MYKKVTVARRGDDKFDGGVFPVCQTITRYRKHHKIGRSAGNACGMIG